IHQKILELSNYFSDHVVGAFDRYRIEIFNKNELIGALIFLISGPLYGYFIHPIAYLILLCAFFQICTPFIVRRGHITFARLFSWINVHIAVYIGSACLGREGGGLMAYIYLSSLIPIFVHRREKTLFAGFVIIYCLFISAQIATGFNSLKPVPNDPQLEASFFVLTLILVVSSSIFTAFHFFRDFEKKHEELEKALTDQEKQTQIAEAAKRQAEEANSAKSMFLANMSHEIRTPMNGVIGMTELLQDTELNREQEDYLKTIRTSGDSLLNIINDILDFSKIESGKIELEKQDVSIQETVEDVLDLLAAKAYEKGLELLSLIQSDVPDYVKTDSTRLRQILINLIGNAIKFTKKGELFVEAYLKGKDADQQIVFAIHDTGIGIPKDKIGKLFSVFQQVDASTTRKFGGTGLGLALSLRLAELMGGTAWVESEVGKGSTFYFSIGLVASDRKPEKPKPRSLAGKYVLIVDDNQTNLHILNHQLRGLRMKTRLASSGEEALKSVGRDFWPDLIVMDYHMPGMDGLECGRRLRELTTAPMIMLSSVLMKRNSETKAVFARSLMKPIRQADLAQALMTALSNQPDVPAKRKAKPSSEQDLASRCPLRILVAEDNKVNQKVVRKLLSKLGYEIQIVGDGAAALEAVKNGGIDLVFMDVQMPVMDGLQATQSIIEQLAESAPPVIAMTANAMQGDREMCLAAGMKDYVSKPLVKQAVVDMLTKWFSILNDSIPNLTK
ncbi:MAG: response regulator, partial [Bacteroidota bacterium]